MSSTLEPESLVKQKIPEVEDDGYKIEDKEYIQRNNTVKSIMSSDIKK